MSEPPLLPPDSLWPRLLEQTERATASGALHSIPTEFSTITDGGVAFLVRVVSNLARKDAAGAAAGRVGERDGSNPFLPYDAEMFVADVSPTHVALLNKYSVVDHHLLIVTRAFEHQENLLTEADFSAMWTCLDQLPGLAFYNGGKIAGASQPHKHLQMVPLPLGPSGPRIPITPLLERARLLGSDDQVPGLPFAHAWIRFDSWQRTPLVERAQRTLRRYTAMMRALGCADAAASTRRSQPYNLLATREWMLLVPRSQEFFAGVSINALGFAGALLVRDQDQLATLRERGPMAALAEVGCRG